MTSSNVRDAGVPKSLPKRRIGNELIEAGYETRVVQPWNQISALAVANDFRDAAVSKRHDR